MLTNLQRVSLCCLHLLLPILLFLTFTVFAQQSPVNTDKDRRDDKQSEPRQPNRPKGLSRSLAPYVPSEKVSADKSVSFPADI